ncbi:MAG: hypothetical protein MK066_10400, partial [Crocinitomicaceae bacterium]|nr:hypothetical protein [Crocinitomicaceae bacterium]
QLLSPVSLRIATIIIDKPSKELILCSDSSGLYGQTILLLILSMFLAYLISKQKTKNISKLHDILFEVNTYILVLFLLKYGLDKLFLHQFYSPEPNTLHTPLGKLSKDIAFWSIMGSSSTYNYFMGIIEIIPAFLLIFHRTRTFAAFVSIGIMINVFVLNIGFDITVKLLSAYLILLSCFIFSKDSSAYFSLFFKSKNESTNQEIIKTTIKKSKIAKCGIILIILIEVFTPYFGNLGFNGHQSQKEAFLRGSYYATSPVRTEISMNEKIKNIHIHKDQYLITEDERGNFKSHRAYISTKDSSILLSEMHLRIKYTETVDTSIFQWKETNQLIELKCKKTNLSLLPLLQDDTHMTVEGILEQSSLKSQQVR